MGVVIKPIVIDSLGNNKIFARMIDGDRRSKFKGYTKYYDGRLTTEDFKDESDLDILIKMKHAGFIINDVVGFY